jgi:hypothetical protein
MEYEELRAHLAERYGWSFDIIDGMTFDQIESAWTGGKRSKGIPVRSMDEAMAVNRNWKRYLGL